MDDKPMPDTLETIAEKLTALGKSIDGRFAKIDRQFEETKSQLGVKIEAVDARVKLVYDEVIARRDKATVNEKEHVEFRERLDKHELRILALEALKAPAPPQT
jgi:hypothetical protein